MEVSICPLETLRKPGGVVAACVEFEGKVLQ